MTKQKIGIALGSGAARGWAHIGVLQELHNEGIEPDIVCGSSMGALVGSAYVANKLDPMKEWACSIGWRDIVGFLDIDLSNGGLIQGNRLMDFMKTYNIEMPIENFKKPFIAVATDLTTGREVWLQKGSMKDAVRASITLPGLFSPVKLDGKWLIDGGIVNPVPVSACRALGADIIIAVNLNGDLVSKKQEKLDSKSPNKDKMLEKLISNLPSRLGRSLQNIAPDLLEPEDQAPGYFDVSANAINIMQDQITRSRLAGEPPHILITPQIKNIGILEFDRAEEAIEEGRKAVRRALQLIREYF
ncbi:patatin-like phospholipase RssA [Pseudemcibacter aquimaris]|uniref:patatin-like phospholipase RssA n=1 Tax=Pseudemcibacter aquimaris TaxID=2857064 RepID=UPI002010ED36|nr:patatin-like phospholipase RssA [Pseudemcibacter aquimaris]MCC3862090.1 patatin-like phospholipase RssA [Pseudemcibacter aquimaris]WDU58843.1 patatin-like phospholipase RssA [Pseudemcibacter aquimaris]